eukprot:gene4341-8638_t
MEASTNPGVRKKKIPTMQKSLAILLASFQGMEILIEMKNDTEISGTLEEADRNMNSILQNAKQVTKYGVVINMDIAFINGSMIRYVHIPPEINMKKIERITDLNRGQQRRQDKKMSADEKNLNDMADIEM